MTRRSGFIWRMALTVLILGPALALNGGCAATGDDDEFGYLQSWNDELQYRIEPRGDAFTVHAYYPRTRPTLEPSIASYLQRHITDIAQHHADEQDRPLAPINPDEVRIGASRNPFTSVMHWHAVLDMRYRPADR